MINFIDWFNIKINEDTAAAPAASTAASTPSTETPSSTNNTSDNSKDQNGTMSSDIAKVPFRLGCCGGFGCYSFKKYIRKKRKKKK